MKARVMFLGSGVISAIVLLVSSIGAQAAPQSIGVALASPISATTQLTMTQSLPLDQDTGAPERVSGDIGSSPYRQEKQRLSENDLTDSTPAVAFNPKRNEYLVVWAQCDGLCDIVGQRTTQQGVPIGNSFTITGGNNDAHPVIGYNSYHGEYLVVYTRYVSSVSHLYGRIILGDGTLWGPELTIDADAGYQASPNSAFNPTATNHGHPGEYLVVYQANDEIVAKHVGSYGDVDASPHLIAGSADFAAPDVAYNPARNEYLVAYAEVISNTPPIHNCDIVARRIAADASLLGSKINIALGPNDAHVPQVAVGNDTYFVAYAQGPNDSYTYTSIREAWLDGTGILYLSLAGSIAEVPPNSLRFPRVAYTGQGFFVTWGSYDGTNTGDTYGRHARLRPSFWSEAFTLDAGPYDQFNSDVACAPGSCLIVESDNSYENGHDTEIVAWNLWLQQVFLPLVLK